MLGLPTQTEIHKALPKTVFTQTMEIKPSVKAVFDEDVSRMAIENVIANKTIPTLKEGETVKSIYVLGVQLKRKDYSDHSIILLAKRIPQNIVLALQYGEETQLVVYREILFRSIWQKTGEVSNLLLKGNDLDEVWENIIQTIGSFKVEEGNTLNEQINQNEERRKLEEKIDALQKKVYAEKQPRRKMELYEQLAELKKQLK